MPTLDNARHESVLQHFIADPERVGWRAYQTVYPQCSQAAARVGWSRLLTNDNISARLAELEDGIAGAAQVSAAAVVEEMAKLAFANMLDFIAIGPDGLPFTDFSTLTREQAAAIAELTVETRTETRIEDGDPVEVPVRKVKLKLADKRGPLSDLGKHLGLFREKPPDPAGKGGGSDDGPPLSDLDVARRIAFLLTKAAKEKSDGS